MVFLMSYCQSCLYDVPHYGRLADAWRKCVRSERGDYCYPHFADVLRKDVNLTIWGLTLLEGMEKHGI